MIEYTSLFVKTVPETHNYTALRTYFLANQDLSALEGLALKSPNRQHNVYFRTI